MTTGRKPESDMIARRLLALAPLALLLPRLAFAQRSWPTRTIKLIVPFPAGGISDALGRHAARLLESELGQPVVVENKPGAGSNIGSEFVAKSPPDGYTLLLASNANLVNMALYRSPGYDTLRDFVPITVLADMPNILVVNSSFAAKTVSDLIEMARKDPNEVAYASAGSGSPAHIAAEEFLRVAAVRMRHVPYKGAAPAIADVMAGHVPVMFTTINSVAAGLRSGRLRALGIASTRRWPDLPEVPTIAEAGLAGYTAGAWCGLLAPAGTPPEVVARLQQAMNRLRAPDSLEVMRKQGTEPVMSTPEVMRERMKAEAASYARLVRETGLTVD
jgi:tripartite-type tricarboxylate transporter receptor subunit TctC